MAVLEAFVHDPLINWALLTSTQAPPPQAVPNVVEEQASTSVKEFSSEKRGDEDEFGSSIGRPQRRSTASSTHHLLTAERALALSANAEGEDGVAIVPEELNTRALAVIRRIKDKLSGNDFAHHRSLTVEAQVELLIQESSAVENLCSCYVGWCPFW